MKNQIILKAYLIGLAGLLFSSVTSRAVSNVLVTIQGTNVVITWPSKTNASYLIQFRAAFDTNDLWVTLTNEYPATAATNRTSFTIYGAVCPPPTNSGGGGSSGGPPSPNNSMALQAGDGNTYYLTQAGEVLSYQDFLPYPWNPRFAPQPKTANVQTEGQISATTESTQQSSSLTSGDCPSMAFYRIFQLPKWPNGISNATVEGLTFAAVDFDDYFSQISNFRLFVDGQPTELGIARTRVFSGATNEGVDFWFNEMANGPRQLQMTVEIRLDDSIDEFLPTPVLTLTSAVTSVTVSNVILYTNFNNTIVGNSTVFEAFSTIPNVNWEINVYDVVDDFVISHSGFSASGQISWTWDLYDWTGLFRDDWEYDPWFYSEITITPQAFGLEAAAAPATKPTPIKVLDYPKTGYWLIVYQDKEKRPTPRQQFIDSMVNLSGGPALHDVLGTPGTLMLRYGTNETQQTRDNTWLNFRANLTGSNIRNLYYQGHGSPSLIGGDFDSYDPAGNITGARLSGTASKSYLTSEWIKNNVTFNKYSGAKYFRCVFLDGCDTSAGDWPQAFGMNKATNSLAFYQNPNRKPNTRPSCFVGWQVMVGGSPQWGTTAPYALWRSEWMFNWGNNAQARELDSAFQLARSNSGWISATLMNSALRLYGYNKLGFLEYNNRSQWNGP